MISFFNKRNKFCFLLLICSLLSILWYIIIQNTLHLSIVFKHFLFWHSFSSWNYFTLCAFWKHTCTSFLYFNSFLFLISSLISSSRWPWIRFVYPLAGGFEYAFYMFSVIFRFRFKHFSKINSNKVDLYLKLHM